MSAESGGLSGPIVPGEPSAKLYLVLLGTVKVHPVGHGGPSGPPGPGEPPAKLYLVPVETL